MNKKCLYCKCVFCKPTCDSITYWKIKKYCSQKCAGLASRGIIRNDRFIKRGDLESKSIAWKGGIHHTSQGYVEQYISPKKYQLQHRYIMEEHLGRRLVRSEQVHHINHDKTDNRICNLQLINIREHSKMHTLERWHKKGAF